MVKSWFPTPIKTVESTYGNLEVSALARGYESYPVVDDAAASATLRQSPSLDKVCRCPTTSSCSLVTNWGLVMTSADNAWCMILTFALLYVILWYDWVSSLFISRHRVDFLELIIIFPRNQGCFQTQTLWTVNGGRLLLPVHSSSAQSYLYFDDMSDYDSHQNSHQNPRAQRLLSTNNANFPWKITIFP